MRIDVAGGGPAGLYFAYLMKRSRPDYQVRVFEQNAPGATYGFGVVFSGRALGFLREGDPAAIARLTRRMESWSDQHIVHRGERVVIDGSSYSAIERLALLAELQALCRDAGVELEFNRRIEPADADCDVLVGADGANSAVRDAHRAEFQTEEVELQNYFAWYGVERTYPAHTLSFVSREGQAFCAHHYRYTPTMSTFIAEVDAKTWDASGMAAMSEDERRRLVEEVFRETLGGKELISNRTAWRRWRLVKNARWHYRNVVLIGDALRTAHPSIGSGTRLAMEDSIALWRAFQSGGGLAEVFERYEKARRPVRDKLNRAGEKSIAWYEDMRARMELPPCEFAYDYLLRTGLMTRERLERESPRFMRRYLEEQRAAN